MTDDERVARAICSTSCADTDCACWDWKACLPEARAAIAVMRKPSEVPGEAITSDPDIQGGLPCIAGTRVPARAIWDFHRGGYSVAEIIREYPTLTPEQVAWAISYSKFVSRGGQRRE
jgi:uncharacterized protein (DUF433 family)